MTDLQGRTFTLASRASALAQVQTNGVAETLRALFPEATFTTSFMTSVADRNPDATLASLGTAKEGKALWTSDLEAALVGGQADLLVHCLKDVPTTLPEGCEIAAVLERADPVDSFVVKSGEKWMSLDELPEGSVVGTGSVRRGAQLRRGWPKLKVLGVRGNLDTRLAKLDDPNSPYSALILAKAGMERVGFSERLTSDLPGTKFPYAVAQGALAIEIRSGDAAAKALCARLNDTDTELTCAAERACLQVLEGGCSVPVGVVTNLSQDGELEIFGCVTSVDGTEQVECTVRERVSNAADASAVGARLAQGLIEKGARKILDEIRAK
ncbi:porphobilinogen deaminase, dipyromethane cofactor binding domain-containing protein, partial [Roridomyces roridus]